VTGLLLILMLLGITFPRLAADGYPLPWMNVMGSIPRIRDCSSSLMKDRPACPIEKFLASPGRGVLQ